MITSLETEAHENQTGDDEGCGDPDYGEACFGLEDPGVATHVDPPGEVVEPVPRKFTEEGGDDGGEVEEALAGVSNHFLDQRQKSKNRWG